METGLAGAGVRRPALQQGAFHHADENNWATA